MGKRWFFEGILAIADKTVKLVQHERLFMGALSVMVKMEMLSKLRLPSISIVHLESVTASPRMLKCKVNVGELFSVSAECLRRARLEAERRYCGNKGKIVNGAEYCPSERDLGAGSNSFGPSHG